MSRAIICVDDDREVLQALFRDLDSGLEADCTIELAESAEDAETLVRELNEAGKIVALIICDQVMPGEGGVEFLSRFHELHPDTKKILLTGYAGLESAIFGINNAHLDRYLEKPWDPAALLLIVDQLLQEFDASTTVPQAYLGDVFDLTRTFHRESPDLYAKVKAFADMESDYRSKGYYLWQRPLAGPCEHVSTVWDPETGTTREMIMVASNNYLGLTTHPKVMAAARQAVDEYGVGTGAVPLLSGTLRLHRELEERIAAYKSGEACVLFPSGFAANLAIISAMARSSDYVFLDQLVHASIIDGAKASRAKIVPFRHSNLDDLAKKLSARTKANGMAGKLIVVDGVYSMDGDIAPLREIIALARQYGAKVMVDEAHSTGVIGKTGGGVNEHFGLSGEVDLLMGTLSKTFGCTGGFCVGNKEVVEYIRVYGRPYMFSTSLPPATVASVMASLDVLAEEPERVEQLRKNSDYLRGKLQAEGFDTGLSETAIIPIIIGDDDMLAKMAKFIDAQDVYLNSVIFPSVSRDNCRLRVSLMATHTTEDLDRVHDVVTAAGKEVGFLG